jgi:hypothetical protein
VEDIATARTTAFAEVLLHFKGELFVFAADLEVDCDGVEDFGDVVGGKTASTTAPIT